MTKEMEQEYEKGGAFKEYVDRIAVKDGMTAREELSKEIVKEYYKSVKEGINGWIKNEAGQKQES